MFEVLRPEPSSQARRALSGVWRALEKSGEVWKARIRTSAQFVLEFWKIICFSTGQHTKKKTVSPENTRTLTSHPFWQFELTQRRFGWTQFLKPPTNDVFNSPLKIETEHTSRLRLTKTTGFEAKQSCMFRPPLKTASPV